MPGKTGVPAASDGSPGGPIALLSFSRARRVAVPESIETEHSRGIVPALFAFVREFAGVQRGFPHCALVPQLGPTLVSPGNLLPNIVSLRLSEVEFPSDLFETFAKVVRTCISGTILTLRREGGNGQHEGKNAGGDVFEGVFHNSAIVGLVEEGKLPDKGNPREPK